MKSCSEKNEIGAVMKCWFRVPDVAGHGAVLLRS
jgi:hypothetical protein